MENLPVIMLAPSEVDEESTESDKMDSFTRAEIWSDKHTFMGRRIASENSVCAHI